MKKIISFICIIQFSFSVYAQIENTEKNFKNNPEVKFYQEFLSFASEELDKTRLDIFIQVPYTEVQFIKTDAGFISNYSVTVSVFDENKEKLIVEKTWNEKLSSKEFDPTVSKNNFNLSLRSFTLQPGKYLIRTAVEDRDSRKTHATENIVVVKDLSADISASDIMLISKQTVVDGNNKIVPNVSKNVAAQKDGLPFFFEIYSKQPKPAVVEYSVFDKKDEKLFDKEENKNLDSGKTQIFYTIKDMELSLGDYTLKVSVKDAEEDILASTTTTFVSRWVGIPSSVHDLDKAVSQLIYIATGSEIDYIEESDNKNEKLKRYLDFWKKKDPTPQTEENQIFDEYYRRIAFANESFSHYIEGWRTDRGMVFIILGSPSNVERHPFDYDSKPYEVWEYYELNKNFVFLDETGFGDYRLITPLYGDFYRYR